MKTKLIIHCSDSPFAHHGVDAIREWHTLPPEKGGRGWSDIGYHFVIERSGELKEGRSIIKMGAHTLGQNQHTGLCMCGNSGEFTQEQEQTLIKYIIENNQDILSIHQHSEFDYRKPYCAGYTDEQMAYFNSLLC